jgi:hypothetical protein
MIELLFWLVVGHAIADYPLQGDFLARAKNHRAPIPGVPFIHGLLPHALIHGGFVALATGSVWIGMAEVLLHALIDFAKCDGRFGEGEAAFQTDQLLHIACKVIWVFAALGTLV